MTFNRYSLDLEASSSQYASITDASQTGLDISGDITIEAWFKPESIGIAQNIVSKYDYPSDIGYRFLLDSSNRGQFEYSGDGSNVTVIRTSSGLSLTAGVWTHLAFAVDVSAKTGTCYVNSVAVSTAYLSGTQTSIHNSSCEFAVGTVDNHAGEFLDGMINNLRIFSDIRTQTEIQDNMYLTLTGTSDNLVGSWFATANNYEDLAGTNDLTASGSPVFSTNVPWTGANATDWSQESISVDYTKISGSADLTDFPALIRDVGDSNNVIPDAVYGGLNDATGGTITYADGYKIHTFTSDGTFTPNSAFDVEYLVVGGGGAGGGLTGGGGGAGGLLQGTDKAVTAQAYSITVGAGGSGSVYSPTVGGDSVFSDLTAVGGGSGASETAVASIGGSGGGGAWNKLSGYAGTAGQGSAGGNGYATGDYTAGGGGGAGAVGGAGNTTKSGDGGVGLASSISGTSTYYAGGGGGGADRNHSNNEGAGGNGGGGDGGDNSVGVAGTANTGGGGGGGSNNGTYAGADGGSGVIIIRYKTASDLRITTDSAGTTEIPFEIVSLDTTAKTCEIHAKIPTLSHTTNTPIYLWYGNASAVAYDANAPFGSQAVWSDYVGVYHLEASGVDSSPKVNSASNIGSPTYSAAQIGNGFSGDGSSDIGLEITDQSYLTLATGTIQAWVKPTNFSAIRDVMNSDKSGNNSGDWRLFLDTNGKINLNINNGAGTTTLTSTNALTANTLSMIGASFGTGGMQVYKNGASEGTNGTTTAIGTVAWNWFIGLWSYATSTYDSRFLGLIDEVRITGTRRTTDWIATEYANQSSPSTFWAPSLITAAFTEGVAIAASMERTISKGFTEAVDTTITIARGVAKSLSEAVTVTGTMARSITKSFSESVSASIAMARSITKSFTESVGASVSIGTYLVIFKSFIESSSMSDSFNLSVTKLFNESISTTISMMRAITKSFAEAITTSESVFTTLGRLFTETVSVSVLMGLSIVKAFVEGISITLAFATLIIINFTESISSSISFNLGVVKAFVEGIGITDIITRWKNGIKILYEYFYTPRGSSYNDKHSSRGTTWTDKY